ncbi:hypothetical protein K435DRAFT_807520 [Dendrothele bispora CBS 962.96]|uniref:Uncharacterized protein n=1 Tax=Dendrothele bispora (strain CBS 962.96) TaxID=1314807 RepID=A0A4S8L4W4_DENBC|nr:hypothetical protein K435DRAFT_807520 [Dendrothele bispora CBS 962.96]
MLRVIGNTEYSMVVALSLPFMFATFLYGVYVVLFVICVYIMTHKKGCVRKMQLIAIVALFVIATLGFISSCIQANLGIKYDIASGSFQGFLFTESLIKASLHFQTFSIPGLITKPSVIADIVLIHRCYKIWGAKKKIIIFPVFISIINNVTEAFQVTKFIKELQADHTLLEIEAIIFYTSTSFLAVNFLTNLVIPLMIEFDDLSSAGRIWWIGRQVSKVLPTRRFNLTRHIMAVCLESGIMYPLTLIPALVLSILPFGLLSPSGVDLTAILIQVVGIAPTFIIDTMRMSQQNGHGDQTVLSMWEANHNIDEHIQEDQTAV